MIVIQEVRSILKRLRYLRERAGISQKALAEQIGVSQQSINKYENHNIEPDIETLIALADTFGTTVDYLIGRSEKPTADSPGVADILDKSEYALICRYRKLSPSKRECVQNVIDNLL